MYSWYPILSMSKNKNRKQITVPMPKRTGDVPVARSGVVRPVKPTFNGSNNTLRVSRKEFVGTVTNGATTGYALAGLSESVPGYDLNPGCVLMFPWLSNLAVCYERFRFVKLRFHFVPSQATTVAGRYYAAIDYDYDDAVADNKTQLLGNHTCIEAPVWEHAVMDADPNSLNRDLPYRYVSCTSRISTPEPRTTYAGFLMVAFDTPTADCLIDMWVEYEVMFDTPVNDTGSIQDATWNLTAPAVAANTAAHGTGYLGTPQWSSSVVESGPVVPVICGANNVPAMYGVYFGALATAVRALDIGGMKGRGSLELLTRMYTSAVSPTTTMVGCAWDCSWLIKDASGGDLGDLADAAVKAVTVKGGEDYTAWSTAGAYVRKSVALLMDQLYAAYPTARYLVPFLINTTAALGAGGNAVGYKATL